MRQANYVKACTVCAGSEVLTEPGAIRDNTSFLPSSSFLARATSKVDLRTVNVCSDTCCDARGCHVRLFILFLSCSPRIARPSPLSSCPLRAVPGCTLLSVRCMPRISLSTCFSSSASSCFLTCGCERVCVRVCLCLCVRVCMYGCVTIFPSKSDHPTHLLHPPQSLCHDFIVPEKD